MLLKLSKMLIRQCKNTIGRSLPQLSAEPKLEDFLDDDQRLAIQRGELTLITIGILTTAYLTYKFI